MGSRGRDGTEELVVLVVDDEEGIRDMYGMVFPSLENGVRIITAANAMEALERVRLSRPDVILMDLHMPGVDGLEATRRLKADASTAHIPVIALTGEAHVHEAHNAGCAGYLFKPCGAEAVMQEIRRVLG
jgi:two-component system, cell cycle response regulator DivK